MHVRISSPYYSNQYDSMNLLVDWQHTPTMIVGIVGTGSRGMIPLIFLDNAEAQRLGPCLIIGNFVHSTFQRLFSSIVVCWTR